MKTHSNTMAILVVAAILAVGGALTWRTFGTSGQDAVDRMTPDERAYLEKLRTLRRGMSFEEIVAVLGRPSDDGPLQMRPRWSVGGNPLNAVAVYIHPDGAHHFTWISAGRFTYQEALRSR